MKELQSCDIIYAEEKALFDTLDSMIEHYRKLKKSLWKSGGPYTPFFDIHDYICKLEDQGKIITNSKKNINYLKEILRNDGPEYALIINFHSKAFPNRKYRIDVCVRGEPLIEKI